MEIDDPCCSSLITTPSNTAPSTQQSLNEFPKIDKEAALSLLNLFLQSLGEPPFNEDHLKGITEKKNALKTVTDVSRRKLLDIDDPEEDPGTEMILQLKQRFQEVEGDRSSQVQILTVLPKS